MSLTSQIEQQRRTFPDNCQLLLCNNFGLVLELKSGLTKTEGNFLVTIRVK